MIPGAEVYVYFSDPGDMELPGFEWVHKRICERYDPPELWARHLREMEADIMFLLTDDCEVFEDTLKQIVKVFEEVYPDTDGVIGAHMVGIKNPMKGSMSATGRKFADRFPGRRIFCSDYKRFFMDSEYTLFAESIGRFYYDENKVRLIHHHPVINPGDIDSTHHNVRQYLPEDREIFARRQKLGYLWGKNFISTRASTKEASI